MKVTFNEDLVPSYELTREETQELEETGYCYDEEEQIGVMALGDNEFIVVRPFEDLFFFIIAITCFFKFLCFFSS